MAAAHALRKQLTWKFPLSVPSSAIIGDSQLKYVHNHFDPASTHSPAFICQPGAYIDDIGNLLDFVPKGISNLILHVGTNDIAGTDARTALDRYAALLERIRSDRPDITMVFATLDHAPQPESYGHGETPSYAQALQRDHPGDACRSGEGNNANIVAPETTTASSTSQPIRSGPPSRGARPATRVATHGRMKLHPKPGTTSGYLAAQLAASVQSDMLAAYSSLARVRPPTALLPPISWLPTTMEYVEGQEVSPEELSDGSWQSPGLRAQKKHCAALRRAAAAKTTTTTMAASPPPPLPPSKQTSALASRPCCRATIPRLPADTIHVIASAMAPILRLTASSELARSPACITTADSARARTYLRITSLTVSGNTFTLHLYDPPPDDALRGILYHAFDDFTHKAILEDLQASNPTLPIVGGRHMGKTPHILVALTEPKVPRWILYHGVHLRLLPFHNKAEACFNCRSTGHRTDVCPKPREDRCHRCGATHPPPPKGPPPTCTPSCITLLKHYVFLTNQAFQQPILRMKSVAVSLEKIRDSSSDESGRFGAVLLGVRPSYSCARLTPAKGAAPHGLPCCDGVSCARCLQASPPQRAVGSSARSSWVRHAYSCVPGLLPVLTDQRVLLQGSTAGHLIGLSAPVFALHTAESSPADDGKPAVATGIPECTAPLSPLSTEEQMDLSSTRKRPRSDSNDNEEEGPRKVAPGPPSKGDNTDTESAHSSTASQLSEDSATTTDSCDTSGGSSTMASSTADTVDESTTDSCTEPHAQAACNVVKATSPAAASNTAAVPTEEVPADQDEGPTMEVTEGEQGEDTSHPHPSEAFLRSQPRPTTAVNPRKKKKGKPKAVQGPSGTAVFPSNSEGTRPRLWTPQWSGRSCSGPLPREAPSLSGIPRLTLAEALSSRPGIAAIWINHRRNIVAVDATTRECLEGLLALTELRSIPVSGRRPADRRSITGFLHGVDGEHDDNALLAGLQSTVPVLSAAREGRTVTLRFEGPVPPEQVMLFRVRFPLQPSRPRPLQCKQCGRYGHMREACRWPESCIRCGQSHTADTGCQRPRCVNCGGPHSADTPHCPRWQEQRQPGMDQLVASLMVCFQLGTTMLPPQHPLRAICLQAVASLQPTDNHGYRLQQRGRGCSTRWALRLNQAAASSVLLYAFPLVALTPARRRLLEGLLRGAVRAILGLPKNSKVAATLAEAGEWPLTLRMLQRALGHIDRLHRATDGRALLERLRSQPGSRMGGLCLLYHQMVPDSPVPVAPPPPHHRPPEVHLCLEGATKR
ncbi:hypothetical protein HPB52_018406 [Rhipicephalus sanguineus]|uniref:CCHC-type domain-containing protein n=1 Tax=Rhipicephalus sanguineus TaxID=34632 RepID=A0A9D4PX86_RHISA|nr:hypothetical protein HPB52_018406 [Rhipicephalus sanguineus]